MRQKKCPDCSQAFTHQASLDEHLRAKHSYTEKEVEKKEKGYQIEQILGHSWCKVYKVYVYDIKWIGYKQVTRIYEDNFGESVDLLQAYKKTVGWPPAQNNAYKGQMFAKGPYDRTPYTKEQLKNLVPDRMKTRRLFSLRKPVKILGFVKRREKGADGKPTTVTCVAVEFEKYEGLEEIKELTSLIDVTKWMTTGKEKDIFYGPGDEVPVEEEEEETGEEDDAEKDVGDVEEGDEKGNRRVFYNLLVDFIEKDLIASMGRAL